MLGRCIWPEKHTQQQTFVITSNHIRNQLLHNHALVSVSLSGLKGLECLLDRTNGAQVNDGQVNDVP